MVFGMRNGGEPVERNTKTVDFDARPPGVRVADEINKYSEELSDEWKDRITEVRHLVEAVEENNRLIHLISISHETKSKGIPGIKALVLTLTWGEMDEMCRELASHMPQVDAQDTKDLLVCNLPKTLHMWAKEGEEEGTPL